MKPDWDKLIDEFSGSKTALIADVDCTESGKSLCEKHDVRGYPTIKYGDPGDLKAYEGGREYDALKKFAEENLGPTCGPDNLDLCDEDDKKQVAKFLKMDADELEMAIEEADAKVKKVDEKHTKKIKKLEGEIQDVRSKIAKEETKKASAIEKESKKTGLKFMKAIASSKNKEEL